MRGLCKSISLELSREDKMLMALKRLNLGERSEGELLSYLRKIC